MSRHVRNPYYFGPASDHFDGTVFFNPGGEAPLGFRELMRWQFGGGRSVWPKSVESPSRRQNPMIALTATACASPWSAMPRC